MTRNENLPHFAVEPLVAQYGKLRLLWAVLRVPRGKALPTETALSDHLQRDIGLIERRPPSKGWESYR